MISFLFRYQRQLLSNSSSTRPVLSMVSTPRPIRRTSWILLMLFAAFVGLLFAPWQQTSFGTGRVIAYTPLERQQNVEAPIKGRIERWYVTEGTRVAKGTLIARIADNDPQLIVRLRTERRLIADRLKLSLARASSYRAKVTALRRSRTMTLRAATLNIRVARQKAVASRQKLRARRVDMNTALLQWKRSKSLFKDHLISKRKLELAKLSYAKKRTAWLSEKANLTGAYAQITEKKASRMKYDADAEAKIRTALADYEKARTDVAYARQQVAKINTKIARQSTQEIRAPQDATVMRLLVPEKGGMVKAGTPVAVLVPSASNKAVEVWIDGNDIPLLSPGQEVRLQFEGWPAVQFVGWPSVAVGTFGGRISLVDAADNGKGKFRVLVVPMPGQDPWPKGRFLRQGVRAKGWIFLNQVTIGYELWRQFNGFPVSFQSEVKKPKAKTKRK